MADQTWRSLAERTGNRIRLLQADLAEADAETRRAVIADEIRAALEQVIPQERELFLHAIEERFPAWEAEGMTPSSAAAPAPSLSATDMAEANDPGWLIRQLQKVAPRMTAEQRLKAAAQLESAGITTGGAAGVSEEALDRLRASMQLSPEASVDMERLVGLIPAVLEKIANIDDIAWKNWGKLSGNSRQRGHSNIPRLMGQFVSGDERVGSLQVSEELERFRRLVAALIVTLSHSGDAAYEQMQKLHPDNVTRIVGGGLMAESKCWRKYCEIASSSIDPTLVTVETLRILAEVVNNILGGKTR